MNLPGFGIPPVETLPAGDAWVIAIGASGGAGLEDICVMLSVLPAELNAIVLIVLHRPWDQRSYLDEVLAKRSRLPVKIAAQGDKLLPGVAYIGEPSIHLTLLERRHAKLTSDRARMYGNRTIDLLFQSVADWAGRRSIGVVLSGALDDGSRGLAAIHHAGGHTMALRPASRASHGLPENAIAFDGPVTVIGSGAELAAAIVRTVAAQSERPLPV